MQDFIEGMQLLLPEDVQLQYDNYPVDLTQKSREIHVYLSINKAIKTLHYPLHLICYWKLYNTLPYGNSLSRYRSI